MSEAPAKNAAYPGPWRTSVSESASVASPNVTGISGGPLPSIPKRAKPAAPEKTAIVSPAGIGAAAQQRRRRRRLGRCCQHDRWPGRPL
jgi:hypothetical protein